MKLVRALLILLATVVATSMFAAPTMIKRLVDGTDDCPAESIRTIVWGGAPMYVEDALKALDRFGPRLAQIYGQGESPMTITVLTRSDIASRDHPRWRERLASAGRAFGCVEVRIADADDNILQAVTGQKPFDIGSMAIETAVKVLKGEKVEKQVALPGMLFSRRDAEAVRKHKDYLHGLN